MRHERRSAQAETVSPFERTAGALAIAAGIVGLVYSASFVADQRTDAAAPELVSALALLAGGLLASGAIIGLYRRLQPADPGLALWGAVLGSVGAIGSATHGAFNLALTVHRPEAAPLEDIPNYLDPRGFLTFAVAGLGVFVLASLILRSRALPRGLGYLGIVLGIFLLVVYLGRLIVLDPENPLLLVPALLTGFVLNPVWYVWLGISLRRTSSP